MAEKSKQLVSSSTFDKANNSSSLAVSSPNYFKSIFEPPSKVTRFELNIFSIIEKKSESGTQFSGVKTEFLVGDSQAQDETSTRVYNQGETAPPFHYDSSLYYGGQDVYFRPQDGKNPGLTTFKKEGNEDDPDSSSRGDWWQGSVYY